MALYDLFKKDKPKKKAAKRKPASTRKQSIARSTAKSATARVKAKQEADDTATLAKGKPSGGGLMGVGAANKYSSAKKRVAKRTPAKKAPAKKAAAKKTSFKSAFADARKAQGAGGTFSWNGKKFTTDRADDKKKSPGSSAYNKKMMSKSPQGRMRSRMRRTRGGK
tara:strand:+ start:445 stop:942 length:498 start_codon:yes stop_codon:yes gene_type:complete